MNRVTQNIPLAIDPASTDQTRVNRELTEAIRQLWQKTGELERLHENDAAEIKILKQLISATP